MKSSLVQIPYLVCIQSNLEEIVEERPERSKIGDRRKQHDVSKLNVELEVVIISIIFIFGTLTDILK